VLTDNLICDGLLMKIVGSEIKEACYLVHYCGTTHVVPLAVRMLFTGDAAITIRLDSDGESLKIADELLEVADLGEAGRIEIASTGEFDPASLSKCVGTTVARATLELSNDKPRSLRLECNDEEIFFANVGDVLNFDERRFRQMITEEGWEAPTIISYPS
jgi:hypothetical protein